MARRSQTELAVLGALSVHPMTGYAVRAAILDVLGHFWSESFGQIYPTLSRLEEEGLIARADRTRSAPYAITDAGLARLRDRLAEPLHQSPPRNPLMLRLFFGRQLGVEACRELVLEARSSAEAELVRFDEIRAEIASETATAADHRFWLLTVSAGEHAARATIAWADEAIAELDRVRTQR